MRFRSFPPKITEYIARLRWEYAFYLKLSETFDVAYGSLISEGEDEDDEQPSHNCFADVAARIDADLRKVERLLASRFALIASYLHELDLVADEIIEQWQEDEDQASRDCGYRDMVTRIQWKQVFWRTKLLHTPDDQLDGDVWRCVEERGEDGTPIKIGLGPLGKPPHTFFFLQSRAQRPMPFDDSIAW